ncbi:hypothetical protein BIU88_09985 [Chlorobaculum limnaeum]|uniref:Uncharacterized protein n=1 Tax=Chlorobaculum limnaeum TaxID=274537 RepID=A0A1D8CZS4_CHLLM|nr:hypothetical protein BIU88_09985 [Chlorobaculum limnaeum]
MVGAVSMVIDSDFSNNDGGYQLPVKSAIRLFRKRVMIGFKNNSMIRGDIYSKFTGPVNMKLMATKSVQMDELFKIRCSRKLLKPDIHFFGHLAIVPLHRLRALDTFLQLFGVVTNVHRQCNISKRENLLFVNLLG